MLVIALLINFTNVATMMPLPPHLWQSLLFGWTPLVYSLESSMLSSKNLLPQPGCHEEVKADAKGAASYQIPINLYG